MGNTGCLFLPPHGGFPVLWNMAADSVHTLNFTHAYSFQFVNTVEEHQWAQFG